ncbi:hypothetical protein HYH03_003082 [Edaphochlamys debaryana]|uniref:Cytosolic carboxypeptidase-like protein 5 n=1 Tax=Edaphochlamys debaryana TaxID=47281 RepID=A0A835YDK3_9CHLO|nr:hypothetical protein HYH03_003082 [Edaphochlamys debaryana]|eukprot:KAG2498891.1 hypothetical protein HYH03_003082 [Edaphochlamys debaryana]
MSSERCHPEDERILLPPTLPKPIETKAECKWKVGKYTFRADFDSANLDSVEQGPMSNEFMLRTRRDCGGTQNEKATRTWFYFSAVGHSTGDSIVFNVLNLNKQSRLYSADYRPVFWCPSLPEWQPLRLKVTYRREGDDFQLRFCHRFESDEETLFAFAIPFSYQQTLDMLDHLDEMLREYGNLPSPASEDSSAGGARAASPASASASVPTSPSPADGEASATSLDSTGATTSGAPSGGIGAALPATPRSSGATSPSSAAAATSPRTTPATPAGPAPPLPSPGLPPRAPSPFTPVSSAASRPGAGARPGAGGRGPGASSNPFSSASSASSLPFGSSAAARRASGVPSTSAAGSIPSALPSPRGDARLYYRRQLLTLTLEGRRVEVLTITDLAGATGELEPPIPGVFEHDPGPPAACFRDKKVFFVSSRVHPGETPATHMFNGLLAFLLRRTDPRAAELRRRFVFKLVPIVNPDGVAVGNYRTDTLGQNLNRFYTGVPDQDLQPSVFAVKSLLMHYTAQGLLEYYIDLHAHANKKGVFLFGNTMDDPEAHLSSLAYARLVALNCPVFDFVGCNYTEKNMSRADKDGASKEGAGRVALYRETGLTHLYTVEANYNTARLLNTVPPASGDHGGRASPPCNKRFPPKFTAGVLQGAGRALLVAALDLEGANPWSRLPHSEHRSVEGVKTWVMSVLRAAPETRAAHLPPMSEAAVEALRGAATSGVLRVSAALGGLARAGRPSAGYDSPSSSAVGYSSASSLGSPSPVAFGRTVAGASGGPTPTRRFPPPVPARRQNSSLPALGASASASPGPAPSYGRRGIMAAVGIGAGPGGGGGGGPLGGGSGAGAGMGALARSSSLPARSGAAAVSSLRAQQQRSTGSSLGSTSGEHPRRELGSTAGEEGGEQAGEDAGRELGEEAEGLPEGPADGDGPSDSDGDEEGEGERRSGGPQGSSASPSANKPASARQRAAEPAPLRAVTMQTYKGTVVYCTRPVTEFRIPLADGPLASSSITAPAVSIPATAGGSGYPASPSALATTVSVEGLVQAQAQAQAQARSGFVGGMPAGPRTPGRPLSAGAVGRPMAFGRSPSATGTGAAGPAGAAASSGVLSAAKVAAAVAAHTAALAAGSGSGVSVPFGRRSVMAGASSLMSSRPIGGPGGVITLGGGAAHGGAEHGAASKQRTGGGSSFVNFVRSQSGGRRNR